ncbi:MAG: hypothetical protein IPM15_21265 [Betaproteobacteria bacterium]|jgi:hypothetical protein|nr:hypothetical protein [Betaproteobacteria bacterium]MCC6247062.1 hypothetical protein [Rubrivivax sp.]MCL4699750.1 hypothetical protein [Burkholderiaceae bacterium]
MRARRASVVAAVLAVAAAGALAAAFGIGDLLVRREGAALYEGRQPLVAHVRGHEQPLPQAAARCTNCHEGAQAIGPRLDERTLAQPLPRRGGPPSRYDAAALCRLLREGIDPAAVLLPRAMPRYQIDARACDALWAHLRSR